MKKIPSLSTRQPTWTAHMAHFSTRASHLADRAERSSSVSLYSPDLPPSRNLSSAPAHDSKIRNHQRRLVGGAQLMVITLD